MTTAAPVRPRFRGTRAWRCALVAALVACGDGSTDPAADPAAPGAAPSTGGPRAGALSLAGPATAPPQPGRYADGSPRLECTVAVVARFAAADTAARARWVDGTARWYSLTSGAVTTTEPLTAATLATLWGARDLAPGADHSTTLTLWDGAPFRFVLDARYTTAADGTPRLASYAVRCEPPAAALTGRYVLSTINDARLPAASSSWTVYADTLEFFPNLTYATRGQVRGADLYAVSTPAQPYTIVSADTIDLPTIVQGTAGGRVLRSGTTLFFTERGCCGRPDYVWRFDREGSSPTLPPPPTIVVTPAEVAIVAVQNGAVPPSVRVAVTSAGATPLSGVYAGVTSGCGTAPGEQRYCFSDWGMTQSESGTTPTGIAVRALRTDLVPGVYTATLVVNATGAAPRSVPIRYTVRAP